MSTFDESSLIWMLQIISQHWFRQLMAWCCQTTNHYYMSQRWHRYICLCRHMASLCHNDLWLKGSGMFLNHREGGEMYPITTKIQQGKSEGFDSCDRPTNLTQIGFKSSIFSAHVTLKFDGWPRKIIWHLFYATWSFLHHFVAIGEFKLGLQSGNA